MTQSNLDELNQTIVDLQSQLDAAKALLRRVAESPVDFENDGDDRCCVRIKIDVMATIRAVVAEDRERSGLQGHKDTKQIAGYSDLIEVLIAVAKWNDNPTLESGLPTELEQMVAVALENVA